MISAKFPYPNWRLNNPFNLLFNVCLRVDPSPLFRTSFMICPRTAREELRVALRIAKLFRQNDELLPGLPPKETHSHLGTKEGRREDERVM